jgi:hypothetical protein
MAGEEGRSPRKPHLYGIAHLRQVVDDLERQAGLAAQPQPHLQLVVDNTRRD